MAQLTADNFKQLRKARNNFLTMTDKYLLIPDLPDIVRNKVIAYRAELRDISSKFGTEWTDEEHVNWPEVPRELIPSFPPLDPDQQ